MRQFANRSPIPAAAFQNTSGIRLALDPIERDTRVALRVCNVGTEARPFRAKLQALPALPAQVYGSVRDLPLGFHGMVQPGQTAEIASSETIVNFAPERLVVPGSLGPAFRIVNVLSDGQGTMPEAIEASLVTEEHNQAALSDPKGPSVAPTRLRRPARLQEGPAHGARRAEHLRQPAAVSRRRDWSRHLELRLSPLRRWASTP